MAKPTSTKTATAGAAKKTVAKPASKATKPTLEKEMGKSVEVAKTKAGKKADTQKKQTEVEKKVEEPVARPVIGKDDKALKDEAKTAEKPVSRKRKSTSDADAKDPEHDPKTIENTSKNAKTKNAKPTAVPSLRSDDKPSKRAKVQVKNPAVTVEATQEEVPLPHVKKAETSSPASKGKAAKGKAVQKAVTGDVAPSAEKPAEGLKSAMKGGKAAAKPKSKAGKKEAEKEDVEMKDVAEGEDDAFIHGFSSSDGEDSSDEEDSDVDMEGAAKGAKKIEAKSLPNVVKDDKEIEQKLAKAKRRAGKEKGVLYLGRIPHGFYEDEMKAYFEQFGDVSRLRLARNKKTGASKHFAYIEMPSKEVAEITAETMNNYLLMGHILQCSVIPTEKIHPDLWIGANRKWRRVPSARLERSQYGKERTDKEAAKARGKLAAREKERKDKLKAAGIDYEYTGFTA